MLTRRSLIAGVSTGIAQMLFHKQLNASGMFTLSTAKGGQLDLRLSAISPRALHIAIAPATAAAPVEELGVIAHSREKLTRMRAPEAPIEWGKYKVVVQEEPLRLVITDPGKRVRQIIQIDTDSTAIRFNLGEKPLFGLGEGMPQWDLRGTKDAMRNGQSTPTLLTAGSRVPIPWVMSPEGWGVFVGQPWKDSARTLLLTRTGGSRMLESKKMLVRLADTQAERIITFAGQTITIRM